MLPSPAQHQPVLRCQNQVKWRLMQAAEKLQARKQKETLRSALQALPLQGSRTPLAQRLLHQHRALRSLFREKARQLIFFLDPDQAPAYGDSLSSRPGPPRQEAPEREAQARVRFFHRMPGQVLYHRLRRMDLRWMMHLPELMPCLTRRVHCRPEP